MTSYDRSNKRHKSWSLMSIRPWSYMPNISYKTGSMSQTLRYAFLRKSIHDRSKWNITGHFISTASTASFKNKTSKVRIVNKTKKKNNTWIVVYRCPRSSFFLMEVSAFFHLTFVELTWVLTWVAFFILLMRTLFLFFVVAFSIKNWINWIIPFDFRNS